eukprot:6204695-Pleurochrysis_carterae.AAC.1
MEAAVWMHVLTLNRQIHRLADRSIKLLQSSACLACAISFGPFGSGCILPEPLSTTRAATSSSDDIARNCGANQC